MKCRYCGEQVQDGARFCTSCGSSLLCSSCGERIENGAKFCTSCGAPVDVRAARPHQAPAAQSHQTPAAQVAPAARAGKRKGLRIPWRAVVLSVALSLALYYGRAFVASSLNAKKSQTVNFPSQPAPTLREGPMATVMPLENPADSGSTAGRATSVQYATAAVPQAGALGAKWDSFTAQINGRVVTFPCTVAHIEATGFLMQDADRDQQVAPIADTSDGYNDTYAAFYDGQGSRLDVWLFNGKNEAQPLSDCLVSGIEVSGSLDVVFPGRIVVGRSAADDLRAAYGAADYESTFEAADGGTVTRYAWGPWEEPIGNVRIDTDEETGIVFFYGMDHYIY